MLRGYPNLMQHWKLGQNVLFMCNISSKILVKSDYESRKIIGTKLALIKL